MGNIRNRYVKIIIVSVLLALPLSGLCLFLALKPMQQNSPPTAVHGVLDLRRWDVQRDSPIKLVGEWEFYWGQLLTSEDFTKATPPKLSGYVDVPNVWNQYRVDGKDLPGFGYATYRLKVKMNEAPGSLALKIPAMSTAYKVMIGGHTVAVSGEVAESKERAAAAYVPQIVVFSPPADEFDIFVQISNYLYARGGMWSEIELGTERQMAALQQREYGIDMVVLGSALIIGLYYLVIYSFRREDRSTLFFGSSCLILVVRMLAVEEIYLRYLFPDIPIRLTIFLEYITYYGGVVLITLFMRELYPAEFSWKIIRPIVWIGSGFLLSVAVFPVEIYTRWIGVFHYVALGSSVYFIYGFIRAVGAKREGALLQLFGALFFVSALAHDILYNANKILFIGKQLVPFGTFVLIFIEAAELARRFSNAFRTIETMSDKLIALDRLKDEFLANTSHELKTPLHGIMNLSQSVLERAASRLNDVERENLEAVVSVARRLANLINDILDFSKLKNGEIVLRRKAVALGPLVSVVLEVFRHMAGDKQVVFVDGLQDNLPDVDADEDRLAQILYNLIGNALKFTEQGEIRVTAEARDGWLEISVHDTGIGIPQDKQEAIFESFEQAGRAIAAEYGGTGLGLSITKRLVELHGGTIRVESTEGVGSVFTFTMPAATEAGSQGTGQDTAARLPLGLAELAAGAPTPSRDLIRTEDSGEYTILVADDDPVNRQVLISLLSSDNRSVIAVSNGLEALRELEQNRRIDLAVIDLMMPGMSGYEVCRSIRERYSLSELPVILLTARNRAEDILAAFEAGVNDFLGKPFEAGELKARIRTLLKLKSSINELVSTEMAFLQAQIKPHFLFNAITTIISVSYTDVGKAQDLLTELSRYLRGSFDFQNRERLIPIRKELELVASYLKIEKARFGERLQLICDVDWNIDCPIPPLVIQPIVENAVRHGAMGQPEGGTVRISVKVDEETVVIAVTDNGPGMPEKTLAALKEQRAGSGGVGLINIERRLRNLYGSGLEFGNVQGRGTTVTIRIPVR